MQVTCIIIETENPLFGEFLGNFRPLTDCKSSEKTKQKKASPYGQPAKKEKKRQKKEKQNIHNYLVFRVLGVIW